MIIMIMIIMIILIIMIMIMIMTMIMIMITIIIIIIIIIHESEGVACYSRHPGETQINEVSNNKKRFGRESRFPKFLEEI